MTDSSSFSRKGRDLLYQHYWWLAIVVPVVVLLVLSVTRDDWEGFLVPTIVGAVGFALAVQRQKLEELKLFKELFIEFNQRYDRLNDRLDDIARNDDSAEDNDSVRETVVDYFNLCAEEYLWRSRGHIPDEVWSAWKRGMKQYFGKPSFKKMWVEEQGAEHYYGFSPDVLDS